MQITIEFHPTILGDLQGELSINYDTGEIVHVALSGVGINLDVRLDKSELQIVPTYIGMANFKNFAINNKGNEIVKFQFSRFATEFEEQKGFGSNLREFKHLVRLKVPVRAKVGGLNGSK